MKTLLVNRLYRPRRLVPLLLISGLITSCSSHKTTVLPQDGPTMKQVYEGHMSVLHPDRKPRQNARPLPAEGIDHYAGFIREAASEITTVFPRLPNPTLVMYIFPHLSGEERSPVPGYVTTFPFYQTLEYALPGEVPPTSNKPE